MPDSLDDDGPLRAYVNSYAFNTSEAIRGGVLDAHLETLARAIRERRMLLDPSRPPRIMPPEPHQVWVWMNGATPPRWEIRGTGAMFGPPDPVRGAEVQQRKRAMYDPDYDPEAPGGQR